MTGRSYSVQSVAASLLLTACGAPERPANALAEPTCSSTPPESAPPVAPQEQGSLGERVLAATQGAGPWFSACDSDARTLVSRAESADVLPSSHRYALYIEALGELSKIRIDAIALQTPSKRERLGEREVELAKRELLTKCRTLLEAQIAAFEPPPNGNIF